MAEKPFHIYDGNRVGVLTDAQLACMLQDFHKSCGIHVTTESELEIVQGLLSLARNRDKRQCKMCYTIKGMCKDCFCAMIELDWSTVGDVNIILEDCLPVKGTEFHDLVHGNDELGLIRRYAVKPLRSSSLQWIVFMVIYAGISAAVAWIVLAPFVKNEVLFSQYGVGISFARCGAALIIVGATFVLQKSHTPAFIQYPYVEKKNIKIYLHMASISSRVLPLVSGTFA